MRTKQTDTLTVAVVAAFSLLMAIGIHELIGHALTCATLDCPLEKVGAFYVEYENDLADAPTSDVVAIALGGPVINLIVGLAAFGVFRAAHRWSMHARFLLWHFFTVNLMVAFGSPASPASPASATSAPATKGRYERPTTRGCGASRSSSSASRATSPWCGWRRANLVHSLAEKATNGPAVRNASP